MIENNSVNNAIIIGYQPYENRSNVAIDAAILKLFILFKNHRC